MSKINFSEVALKISSQLEYLIKTKKTDVNELAKLAGINYVNFSKKRSALRAGVLPNNKFIVAISYYYKKNFLE